ncbi:MAG: hypothetical protein J6S92_11510, partial [Oscillospiraceae bacterium]|nr:hypothetical protein [Oscillospiraceae bacterium]
TVKTTVPTAKTTTSGTTVTTVQTTVPTAKTTTSGTTVTTVQTTVPTAKTTTSGTTVSTVLTTESKQVTTVSIPVNAPAVIAESVSANAGETVDVKLTMQNNPGIAALSLNISYDSTKLRLLGAADGKILGTSTFLAGNDLTLIPYTLNWDDLADDNNTGNGVVATLHFEVLAGAGGTAVIEVSLNQKSTFNVDLEEVRFYTGNGAVVIGSSGETGTGLTVTSPTGTTATETTETETTTQPVGPAIIGGTVSAKKGDTVELPIRLYNNPGIAALSLNVSYDKTKLKLLGAADGKILGTSVFLSGNDLTLIPYTLNWDDLSTENNTGNGIVAKLTFEVLASEGQALVEIALNQKSTFNVDLEEVAFATGSGKVKIGKADVSDFLLGDVNLDGAVSVEDAQLALTAYANLMADIDIGLTELQQKAADINADGQVSVDDAQNILLYYVSNTLAGIPLTWDELLGR